MRERAQSPVQVRRVTTRKERQVFIRFPWRVYRGDPQWVPPLLRQRDRQLDPARGTFFTYGQADLFIAWRGDEVVGTIVAWINHRYNKHRGQKAAGFGFFEVLDDYLAAEALLNAACDWARQRGMEVIRGPYYFSMDDSPGVLIKGFDQPQVMMNGHTPPYYAGLIERFGFHKYRDAYAYRAEAAPYEGDITRLPPMEDGVPFTLADFQQDVKNVLGDNFGEIINGNEEVNESGLHLMRVVTSGTISGLSISWVYYHITNDQGERASCVFTFESDLADRFEGLDQAILSSFRFHTEP